MPEHYTRNTLECTAWCAKCQKMTQYRVDGGRRGPCLEHEAPKLSKAQEARQRKAAQEARQRKAADKQAKLFD
jgi:hypothetical protein